MASKCLLGILLVFACTGLHAFSADFADVSIAFDNIVDGNLAVTGRMQLDLSIAPGNGDCLVALPFPLRSDTPFIVEPSVDAPMVLSGGIPPENAYYVVLVHRDPAQTTQLRLGFATCTFRLSPSLVAQGYGAMPLAFMAAADRAALLLPEASVISVRGVSLESNALEMLFAENNQTPSRTARVQLALSNAVQSGSLVVYLRAPGATQEGRVEYWLVSLVLGLPLGVGLSLLVKSWKSAIPMGGLALALGVLTWRVVRPTLGVDERTAASLYIAPFVVTCRVLWFALSRLWVTKRAQPGEQALGQRPRRR